MTGPATDLQRVALGTGRRLQYATIAWNLMEVFVTIGLGIAARSLALVAFGLDSLIEVFASLVVVWYIAEHQAPGRARRALRLVAVAFLVLATYLIVASTVSVATGEAADSSPFGIAYLAVTAVVMFTLARLKRGVAVRAESEPLAAEASMTYLDGWLASGILVALLLNSVAGLWWADPASALLVAAFCVREAVENWQEARSLPPAAPSS